MSYIPPTNAAVDFELTTSYNPQNNSLVEFNLGDLGGSACIINSNFAISNVQTFFSEAPLAIERTMFLQSNIVLKSGTEMQAQAMFSIASVIESFSQGLTTLSNVFDLYTRVDIGQQSYSAPHTTFALLTDVKLFSEKTANVYTTFALISDILVTVRGEPIEDVSGSFKLLCDMKLKTEIVNLITGLALNTEVSVKQKYVALQTITTFELAVSVDSETEDLLVIEQGFGLSTGIDISLSIDPKCELLDYLDTGGWT